MIRVFGSILLGILMIAASAGPLNPAKTTIRTIVIDAGHGGKDPGALGHSGSREKDVTLRIALKLGQLLKDSLKDVRVVYTRNSDHFVELWERATIANKNNADLFISIHCNANNSHEPHGSETYIMGLHKTEGNLEVSKRENASILMEEDYQHNQEYMGYDPNTPESHIILSLFQSAYREQSLQFAQKVQKNIENRKTIKNRGVKEAGFLVLWRTSMPSVLIETGFITNEKDKEYLNSAEGQMDWAQAIFGAVRDFKQNYEQQNR